LDGDVDLPALVFSGIDLGAARGPFSISHEGFRSTGLGLGGGQVTMVGQVALSEHQTNQFSVALRAADLLRVSGLVANRSWPSLEGRLEGNARVEGPWRSLRLSGQGSLVAAKAAGQELGDGKLDVSADGGRWQMALATARGDRGSLSLRVTHEATGALTGVAAMSGWRLEQMQWVGERWPQLRGAVEGSGNLRGTVLRPEGDASLRLKNLAAGEHEIGDCELQVRGNARELSLQARALGSVGASATISLEGANSFRLHVDARDTDLSPFLPKQASGVSARLTGNAELMGDRRLPLRTGRAHIQTLRITREGKSLENRGPLEVRVAEGRVELVDVEMLGDGQTVRLEGHWAEDEAELRVSAKADLALVESFSQEIVSARGPLEADVRATRRGGDPWRYRGQVKLEGGAVDLGLLIGVTQISATIDLEDRTLDVREATGKLGGGEFLVSGSVSLDRGFDLGWALREASLEVPSWLDYRASGNGRFVGELSHPALQGEIEVDQALYDQPIEWADFLPWFRKQTRSAPGKRQLPVAIDLHVVADGGLFVDNNLVKAELRGDLQIVGGSDALAWSGSIGVLTGEFTFRRRRFTITSGTIGFRRERSADPDLQFHGETHVSTRDAEYEIQVDVSGTADQPRIVFTADDPSLSENDVLALVTFGRTVSQLQSQGASIELGEVLKVTAGTEGGAVEKSIYSLLPVDRIEIEPSFSRGTGASEPRLSIAKDLTDRFSAVIGAGLGSEKNQDVGLEYRVTRSLSFQTVWQSQTKSQAGAIAGNLKFRVPFRTLRSFSLLPISGFPWH
jgi:translocation and assembly module TamB